jgi:hypothetical protein
MQATYKFISNLCESYRSDLANHGVEREARHCGYGDTLAASPRIENFCWYNPC